MQEFAEMHQQLFVVIQLILLSPSISTASDSGCYDNKVTILVDSSDDVNVNDTFRVNCTSECGYNTFDIIQLDLTSDGKPEQVSPGHEDFAEGMIRDSPYKFQAHPPGQNSGCAVENESHYSDLNITAKSAGIYIISCRNKIIDSHGHTTFIMSLKNVVIKVIGGTKPIPSTSSSIEASIQGITTIITNNTEQHTASSITANTPEVCATLSLSSMEPSSSRVTTTTVTSTVIITSTSTSTVSVIDRPNSSLFSSSSSTARVSTSKGMISVDRNIGFGLLAAILVAVLVLLILTVFLTYITVKCTRPRQRNVGDSELQQSGEKKDCYTKFNPSSTSDTIR